MKGDILHTFPRKLGNAPQANSNQTELQQVLTYSTQTREEKTKRLGYMTTQQL